MRTTLTVDDDVLAIARALAARKGSSLGSALSELARRGFREMDLTQDDGVPVFRVAAGARPITGDDVQRAFAEWP